MYMFVIYKRYTSAHPWVTSASPGSLPLLPLESLQSRDATLVPCTECIQQIGMPLGGAPWDTRKDMEKQHETAGREGCVEFS